MFEVSGLSFHYQPQVPVLTDLTFSVLDGKAMFAQRPIAVYKRAAEGTGSKYRFRLSGPFICADFIDIHNKESNSNKK